MSVARGRRVLSVHQLAGEPTVLAPPDRELDDATRRLVERERAEAHALGVAAGEARGIAQAQQVAAAVAAATSQLAVELRSQHAALAAALGERVVAATAAVLGRAPDDDGRAVVDRVVRAIALLDEPAVTVHVSTDRHAPVEAALAETARATVVADPTLGRDEARVSGAFADVDLRIAALLHALDEVLATTEPLGPIPSPDGAGDAEVAS